jgi:hypothetical protein
MCARSPCGAVGEGVGAYGEEYGADAVLVDGSYRCVDPAAGAALDSVGIGRVSSVPFPTPESG